jgi:hypothetical protein
MMDIRYYPYLCTYPNESVNECIYIVTRFCDAGLVARTMNLPTAMAHYLKSPSEDIHKLTCTETNDGYLILSVFVKIQYKVKLYSIYMSL